MEPNVCGNLLVQTQMAKIRFWIRHYVHYLPVYYRSLNYKMNPTDTSRGYMNSLANLFRRHLFSLLWDNNCNHILLSGQIGFLSTSSK